MKNLKFESVVSLMITVVSFIISFYIGNGLYFLFGFLYSIIIFFTFFVARKKYKYFNAKEVIKFFAISLLIIIFVTALIVILFLASMQSFMEAISRIG